jgi:hypothetical protein
MLAQQTTACTRHNIKPRTRGVCKVHYLGKPRPTPFSAPAVQAMVERSPASQAERPGPHRGGGATDTRRGYMFALPALGVATMRRIAVEHLLNPLRINFDLDATSFELEQRG